MTDLLAPPFAAVLAAEGGPGDVFDPAVLTALDEREQFPAEAARRLDQLGLPRHYVPVRYGGALHDLPELLGLVAAVAGRDLTLAVAHAKTFLGAVSVWVAGDDRQARRMAERVAGGAAVCWALTEPGHGADLLAGEVTAVPDRGGWRLDGTKWTVNNATRGELACVLARTDPAGGPRGFSLFLVETRDEPAVRPLPKIRTHGIRGADISGFTLRAARVPASALVGRLGGGMETVTRALQLTRVLCTGLSVGAAARAVRIASGFAAQRQLYGRTLAELPLARRTLGTAVASMWVAEAVATVAARSAHTRPGELSVLSPVAKALVPSLVDGLLAELGELLGVRGYLTGEFEKLERDHRIVAIFDGSTAVNRAALARQFPLLARAGVPDHATGRLAEPLDELDPAGLRLVAHRGCGLVAAVPALVAAAGTDLASRFGALAAAVRAELAAHEPARELEPEAFTLAERYELVVAGAACLQLAEHNPDRLDAGWLAACLTRVLQLLGEPVDGTPLDAAADDPEPKLVPA
jgi:alkylation response protein AidB-like acyl-CoA dehydrogenase